MQTSKRVGESLKSCGKLGNGINLTSIPPSHTQYINESLEGKLDRETREPRKRKHKWTNCRSPLSTWIPWDRDSRQSLLETKKQLLIRHYFGANLVLT